jgi:glycosyltransferase involved in cell wall biosynthesis
VQIFRIGNPSLISGGGGARVYKVLQYLPRYARIILIPTFEYLILNCKKSSFSEILDLEKRGVSIPSEVFEVIDKCTKVKISKLPNKLIKLEKEFLMNFTGYFKESSLALTDHELYQLLYALKEIKTRVENKISGFIIQTAPGDTANLLKYLRIRGFNLKSILAYLRNIYSSFIFKESAGHLDFVLGITKTTINDLIKLNLIKNNIITKVIYPANAVDEEIFSYSTTKKETYAVYYARLIPHKGVREVPWIWKKVNEVLKDAKLLVLGKFSDAKLEKWFLSKSKNLNIEFRGFVPRKELLKIVSKAKVTVYPTHFDSFSLVILESLALKTPIVSYGLPSLIEVYNNLPPVRFVREFDKERMAEEIIKIITMKDEDYENLFRNKRYEKFIEDHNSWDKVAKSEFNIFNEILDNFKKS